MSDSVKVINLTS